MIDTPAAFGPALFKAFYKVQPLDFQVSEVLDIQLDGAGEHLYLHIEKTATNTDEVASLLENTCSLTSADIGVSGLKDRHAVTRQWFSVKTPLELQVITEALEAFNETAKAQAEAMVVAAEASGEGQVSGKVPYCKQLTLLESVRHSRKLRSGAHSGNGFVIILRDIESLSSDPAVDFAASVDERIAALAANGFPNYIGPQRFGLGGQNLVRARQWFRQPKKRTSRQQRSLWLSAARSALFNDICAARVRQGSWQSLLQGEPAVLDGTRSFFDTTEVTSEELETRLAAFDIHPSGAWWGRGRTLAQGACADFEQQIVSEHADLCAGLERGGLTQERRALRARAVGLQHVWLDENTLELRFHLSPGVFATTLLLELGLCNEPAR
ncbi:tRNA pseudouridine(13) synthase TruD [Granulosicoccus antarcticus]|uniref:tRNA pseudouridine synthase D n=1 Tax=Granulosicoccus antarcticus IMCC3135 TaxID=1192854 RepID=A0A2Z2NVH1_9GAMM|nr:tRNA pseudouridine(13) synthase TruD [Granulosicoccus antarcticus]ASJ74515.1 tRNA pseudouridine synthase D [Granulosicoccus antarcticus IMCC3135]